ncbi:MAG: hypothetical protein WAS25_13380 [Geothrix sp.]|uniref:hypothetical protein n=1 Tax=Geothrix sp. TaxID=1962974 RepID=UPI003BB190E4
MRKLTPLLLLFALPLAAQSTLVSVIRQPRATAAEFTVPITELRVKERGEFAHLHLGVGLGVRHWDDGDNALRFVVDASATANELFLGLGAIVEAPQGEGAFLGPRLRVGWAFHPRWVLSLEGEHLERPFASGLTPRRRSNVGLVLTARF